MTLSGAGSLLRDGSPDDPVLVWGTESLHRGHLERACDALASHIDSGTGQRVAVVAPNVPALVVGIFASWKLGAVAVPLSSRLRRYELSRVFADCEPTAIVSIDQHGGFHIAQTVRELATSIGTIERQIVVDEHGNVGAEFSYSPRRHGTPLPDTAATLLYTSGSTGQPKGAVLSHAYTLQAARSFQDVLGTHAGAPTAYVVPISHMFGYATLLASILAGGPAVLVDKPGATAQLSAAIERHSVQVLHGSPSLFSSLLQAGPSTSIRTGFVAGSRCSPELLSEWERRGTRLLNQYGMTELGAVTACRLDDSPDTRHNTVGRALPSFEVRTVESHTDGSPTEIQVRGRHVWPTLYGRPWPPDEMTEDGWVKTGDLGFVDPNGNVTIAGRAKDVVQVGGFSVFPAEVEGFLTTHPGVTAVAVVGTPHHALGEALTAFVVADHAIPPTARELTGFCRAGIAGYKVPTSFRFIEKLPLLSSGKVDRLALGNILDRHAPSRE